MSRRSEPSEAEPGGSGSAPITVVVSDVHLCEAEPGSARAFVGFLAGGALSRLGARRLVLLGDIFDAWFGASMARIGFYREVLEHLAALRSRGVRVTFVAGNRDFLFDSR